MTRPLPPITFRAIGFHAAPGRSVIARAVGLARLARYVGAFKGGDFNVTAIEAARILRRRVIGTGVICLAVPLRGWRVVKWEAVDVGGDHDALLATVRHKRTGKIYTVLVINCMSYSAGKLQARSVMRAGMALDPDVIIGTECVDFSVSTLPGSKRYDWHQAGAVGSSESGAVLGCLHTTFVMSERRSRTGSEATSVGWIDKRTMVRARFTSRAARG